MTATAAPELDTAAAKAPVGRLRDEPLLIVLVVLAQLVVLQLVLRTPFLGDDGPNQVAAGYANAQGESVLEFVWHLTRDQYYGLGRFTPLSMLQNYGLNALIHERVLYKAVLVAMTIAGTLGLARVLVSVRVPVAVALLGAGLTAPLWQLHAYHDALISYGGLMQSVLLLGCGATLCHLRWLRGGTAWWAVASVLLLITANLVHEAGFLMVGMVVGATFAVSGRLRSLVPALAVTAGFVLFIASIRTDTGQYSASLALEPFTATVVKQVTAALPGASWLDPQGAKIRPATDMTTAWLRAFLVALLLAPVIRAAFRAAPLVTNSGQQLKRFAGLAMLLGTPAIVPAALVSLATRYQAEMRWGTGYLPLYLSVAALAAATALLLWWCAQRVSAKALGAVTVAGIVLAVGANVAASSRVVSADFAFATTQDEMKALARGGAFDRIPTSNTILVEQTNFQPPNGIWLPNYIHSPSNWLYVHAGRRWASFPVPADAKGALCVNTYGEALPEDCPAITAPVVWARTGLSVERQRWLLLTPAKQPAATDTLMELPATGEATLFYPADRKPPTVYFTARRGQTQVAVPPTSLKRISGDADKWARYAVPVPKGASSGTGTVN